MPSTPEPSAASPISRVPYDILREIFTRCLPQYPLHYRQLIAPILLCHICSSWRTIALGSAALWAHLNYCFFIVEKYDTDSSFWTYEFSEYDVKFIRWWKKNQGTIAPFLNFNLNPRRNILSLIWLDMVYWSTILERIKAGRQVIFPNLHTQVMEAELVDSSPFYQLQSLLPAHALSAMQRLLIAEDMPPRNLDIPNHWATLTQINMSRVLLSIDFWSLLIRAAPHLRWGYFDIASLSGVHHATSPQCTHLQLTTLVVVIEGSQGRNPLDLMFHNLHLPALRILTLSSPGTTRQDLTLERRFLPASIEGIAPVWNRAPLLVHLQLDFPFTLAMNKAMEEETLDNFVRNIFSSNNAWLDLQNPEFSIQSITINHARPMSTNRARNLVMSKIRGNVEKAPGVIFEISSVSSEQIAEERRGIPYLQHMSPPTTFGCIISVEAERAQATAQRNCPHQAQRRKRYSVRGHSAQE
ncbi:hypothetical protein BJ912DRAFT_1064367 [Pholiota molesta]|nr:hypothetical protein BJ912DRAFT_1064367 [Pholiota molesta]